MLNLFKKVAIAEAWSFLILVFIAMPLKYIFTFPQAVQMFGWVHGMLFVAYVVLLIIVWQEEKWSFKKAFLGGIAALIPFGPFWFDKRYLSSDPAN